MTGDYLGALLVSIGSMAAVDRRWRLFLWADARRGAVVMVAGIAMFLSWDAVAIGQGFFQRGLGKALTGIWIAPHMPIEELFFVTFLCYLTMVLHGAVQHVLASRQATGRR